MLADMSLTAVLCRMDYGSVTLRGFRSTFRDWCPEFASNAFSRQMCEHALAHKLPDKVESAYRRGDLLDQRRKLMAAWAEYLGGTKSVPNAGAGQPAFTHAGWRGYGRSPSAGLPA
ncbi:hypothetical protein [Massilia sp. PWRC2]|uniref:hypothetical protein n=1 Tax=Massilia sp. PWRC2 TaxID=2804626 RepID=UPI003CF31622